MRYVVPASVFLLMVSVGMSLRYRQVLDGLRRMRWTTWLGLLLATFIVPAGLALLLGRILPFTTPEMAGLFLVGAAPGAPLMTRNIAKRGFDMQLAAGYQVWGGLLTPSCCPSKLAWRDCVQRASGFRLTMCYCRLWRNSSSRCWWEFCWPATCPLSPPEHSRG